MADRNMSSGFSLDDIPLQTSPIAENKSTLNSLKNASAFNPKHKCV